jgi:inner membrane protein
VKILPFVKIATVLAVMVALLFGLGQIQDIVRDRYTHRDAAMRSVADSIAGSQSVVGPIMHSACVESWDVVDRGELSHLKANEASKLSQWNGARKGVAPILVEERREFMLTALPETLTIKSNTGVETRSRGLFPVNVYTMKAQLVAQWPSMEKLKPAQTHKGSRMVCGAPIVMVSVGDPRGIRSAQLRVDGQDYKLKAGTFHPSYSRGVHAMLPDSVRNKTDAVSAEINLELVGTEHLSIVPLGETTQVQMQSNWPHPSFGGRFSPAERTVSDKGFEASWRVTSMASNAGQAVMRGRPACQSMDGNYFENTSSNMAAVSDAATAAAEAASGKADKGCAETLYISFIDPVNPYALSDRATKYGLLFVVLTFVAVGLFELMHRLRVHPVQYFLVGSAISIFFLLLVSLSEHLGFGPAYASAAVACVALLTYYASHMLGGARRGVPFGLGIAALYGLLFVLLQLEQTALVVGSIALFVVLAAVMALTRKLDWYGLSVRTNNTP